LPISRRERATKRYQKTNDLAREAIGCMGVFGDPVVVAGSATRMCRPHPHGTTPAQRALIGTTRIWDHALHNGP